MGYIFFKFELKLALKDKNLEQTVKIFKSNYKYIPEIVYIQNSIRTIIQELLVSATGKEIFLCDSFLCDS